MGRELVVRFVVGGALVSAFALLGDLFKPKSFAGLFAGAPSVALATLVLTANKEGARYTAIEARSMVVGAVAFVAYTSAVSWILSKRRGRPRSVAALALMTWTAIVVGGWALWLSSAAT